MYKQDGSSEELEKIGYVKFWHGLRYVALPWFRTSLVTSHDRREQPQNNYCEKKRDLFFIAAVLS